jgi:hypothetical protein
MKMEAIEDGKGEVPMPSIISVKSQFPSLLTPIFITT